MYFLLQTTTYNRLQTTSQQPPSLSKEFSGMVILPSIYLSHPALVHKDLPGLFITHLYTHFPISRSRSRSRSIPPSILERNFKRRRRADRNIYKYTYYYYYQIKTEWLPSSLLKFMLGVFFSFCFLINLFISFKRQPCFPFFPSFCLFIGIFFLTLESWVVLSLCI